MKAKELLNTIKNNQNIIIPILKNGKVVKNDVTENLNDLFSYDWGYGIYGDAVKHFEQLDSRDFSDEEIVEEIQRLLDEGYEFGEVVNVD